MSKIGGSSKIQRLLKESSLLCHSGNLAEAKKIYQDLLKLIPNHQITAKLKDIQG
jgi:hypothetical protein